MRSGVPQRSVLTPTLFLVYIYDLLESLQSEGRLFADEAKIYRKLKSPTDGELMQDDIAKLETWSRKSLLQFNETKCKVMHTERRNP